MVVGPPPTLAMEPALKGYPVGQSDSEYEKRGYQIYDRVTDIRGVFKPARDGIDVIEIISQHHQQDCKSSELVDSIDSISRFWFFCCLVVILCHKFPALQVQNR